MPARSNVLTAATLLLILASAPQQASAVLICPVAREGCANASRTSARTLRVTARERAAARLLRTRKAQARISTTTSRLCGNGRIDRGEQCDDGNRKDGDGCSSLCISVPEPVRHGFLRFEEISVPDDDIVAGQKGKTLMRFRATAGRQDVELMSLTLLADTGVPSTGYNYRLFLVGSDGAATAASPLGVGQGTRVIIGKIGLTLTAGTEYSFEVRSDISSSPPTNALSLGFDTTNDASIHAVGAVDGRELTGIDFDGAECGGAICWIEVHTAQ